MAAEIERLIDASDVVLLGALEGRGDLSLEDAIEHVLRLHGRARVLLGASVIAEVE